MLFGRKKEEGKTVLVLDIESGSVGAALARLNQDGTLRLMSEMRTHSPIRHTRSAEILAKDALGMLGNSVKKVSEFASTLRHGAEDPSLGRVSGISVFMSPPWGKPNLQTGTPDFVPHMKDMIRKELSPYFDITPNFYTGAGAASAAMRALLPYEDKYLLCIVTHEMTELLLIYNGAVAGHATIPHGINLPLRTMKSHGNLSDAEARSALHLGHLEEPLLHATESYAKEFKGAARELLDMYAPERAWVISPMGEHFAKTLSHDSLSDLFPQGGVARALKPHHASKHIDMGLSRDLFLILEALYVRYTQ